MMLFVQVLIRAPRQSRDWFRKKVQNLRNINRTELLQSDELKLVNKSNPLIGSMNMFFYESKAQRDFTILR